MSKTIYPGTPVRQGTFVYDGSITCDVRIVQTAVRYGTGDPDESPEIAEDQPGPCFYVEWGSSTDRGDFTSGVGGFGTLADAMTYAESQAGKIAWDAAEVR